MAPGAERWAVVAVAAVVAAAAVVVFVQDYFCPRSYAQKNLCSLALQVGSEQGDMPKGTTKRDSEVFISMGGARSLQTPSMLQCFLMLMFYCLLLYC